MDILRCLDTDGIIAPLGNISPRHAQRSSKEPDWAANTAYQWRLLANIQKTIVEEQLTLDRFLKHQYTPQLAGRVQGLRTMLNIDYNAVLSDGEMWFDANDPHVKIYLLLLHCILN